MSLPVATRCLQLRAVEGPREVRHDGLDERWGSQWWRYDQLSWFYPPHRVQYETILLDYANRASCEGFYEPPEPASFHALSSEAHQTYVLCSVIHCVANSNLNASITHYPSLYPLPTQLTTKEKLEQACINTETIQNCLNAILSVAHDKAGTLSGSSLPTSYCAGI